MGPGSPLMDCVGFLFGFNQPQSKNSPYHVGCWFGAFIRGPRLEQNEHALDLKLGLKNVVFIKQCVCACVCFYLHYECILH